MTQSLTNKFTLGDWYTHHTISSSTAYIGFVVVDIKQKSRLKPAFLLKNNLLYMFSSHKEGNLAAVHNIGMANKIAVKWLAI